MEPLKEIDFVYKSVISLLPDDERLAYCEQLIDKTQLTIIRNKHFMSKSVEKQLGDLIESAKEEIKHLKEHLK